MYNFICNVFGILQYAKDTDIGDGVRQKRRKTTRTTCAEVDNDSMMWWGRDIKGLMTMTEDRDKWRTFVASHYGPCWPQDHRKRRRIVAGSNIVESSARSQHLDWCLELLCDDEVIWYDKCDFSAAMLWWVGESLWRDIGSWEETQSWGLGTRLPAYHHRAATMQQCRCRGLAMPHIYVNCSVIVVTVS